MSAPSSPQSATESEESDKDVKPPQPTQNTGTRSIQNQPERASAFLKAFANAIRSYLTADGDLSLASKAIFVSTSLQRGVPIKTFPEYSNQRIWSIANPIQDAKSPVFYEGGMSYAKFLKEYVESVQDTSKPDYARLKAAEDRHRKWKHEASLQLELATYRFRTIAQTDSSASFESWLQNHGMDYSEACEERDAARQAVKKAQESGSADVKRARDILVNSLDGAQPGAGTSMPCAIEDLSDDGLKAGGTKPTNVIYQPLHILEGFNFSGDGWRNDGLSDQLRLTKVEIKLADGFKRSWRELGFPDIRDSGTGFGVTSDAQAKIFDVLKTWRMYLQYTGLHAFDVSRGLWNIESFRTTLPELSGSAPAYLKKKIFRTDRLLLAYNVDIILRLPAATFQTLFPAEAEEGSVPEPSELSWPANELLADLFAVFPFAKYAYVPGDKTGDLHLRRTRNELYPTVLGVLARKC